MQRTRQIKRRIKNPDIKLILKIREQLCKTVMNIPDNILFGNNATDKTNK
jgi:hypothetical protein